MRKLTIFTFILIFKLINAQSSVNPDISLIGTFNTFTNFNDDSPEKGKLNFESPSLEMFITGYLNPFAKANADISYHDNEFAAEEIYFEVLRGLPLDMQLKAGKYLLGLGKINTVHEHAWPFIERPLAHQILFGEEGLNDIGFKLSFLLPTEDFYSNFDIGIYKGDSFRGLSAHVHDNEEINEQNEEHDEEFELGNVNAPVVLARLSSFFNINDYSNLEFGLSGAGGILGKARISNSASTNIKFIYGAVDFKYKYKPDMYTSLTIQGEGILNHRDVVRLNNVDSTYRIEGPITTFGAFIFLEYQFYKIFSIGAKYDFTYGIVGDEQNIYSLANDNKNRTQGISGWFGYYPVEETLLFRLGVEHLLYSYESGFQRNNDTNIKLQMIFSLGPHKAHQF